jgi:hypothetical protein
MLVIPAIREVEIGRVVVKKMGVMVYICHPT